MISFANLTRQPSQRHELLGAVMVFALVVPALVTMPFGGPADAGSAVTSVYGPELPLGRGAVRTYVDMQDGRPIAVGVAMDEATFEGLPGPVGHHGKMDIEHAHQLMVEYVVEMPTPNPTPFRHVALNWNPGGHEPPGVYDVQHFDFHFNTITDAERRTIAPDVSGWAEKEARLPADEYRLAGYVPMGPAVPLMGVHWLDPQTPELNGQPFTETFLFGSWDGEVIFWEPMITKAFLEARQEHREALPVPQKVSVPGWYPSSYAIRWDAERREYRIVLEGLVEVR